MPKQIRLKDKILPVKYCTMTQIDQTDMCPCFEQGCGGDGFVGPATECCNLGCTITSDGIIPADCPLEDAA